MPTKSDALVVGFRKWLKKYAGNQVNWGNKFEGGLPALPPTPPREQLMDRYAIHLLRNVSLIARLLLHISINQMDITH